MKSSRIFISIIVFPISMQCLAQNNAEEYLKNGRAKSEFADYKGAI